jgi:hypothetical protein
LIIENFILSGNIPEYKTLLNIYVKGDKIHGVLILSILEDISSYPWESAVFKDCIILLIS